MAKSTVRTPKPCEEASPKKAPGLPPVYQHLYALLHTLRALQTHEDQICTLLTEIKRTGKAGPRAKRELETLLNELPSVDAEVQAIWAALEAA